MNDEASSNVRTSKRVLAMMGRVCVSASCFDSALLDVCVGECG